MTEIIAKYYNLPIFTTKYTFKQRVFKFNDIKGSLIDELREIGNFDSVLIDTVAPSNFKLVEESENTTDYPLILLENKRANKILEVTDSHIKFQSAIGDNYPHIASNYIDQIFKKLEYVPNCGIFGTAISYVYLLEQESFSMLWNKFNCYKDLNINNEKIIQDNLTELNYQNIYRKDEEDFIIKFVLNKSHMDNVKPNCEIYIDSIIRNKNIENKDKKIKESIKVAINIISDIGIKIK